MPIRPPALDDRDFADLVEELLARVAAHTPEWSPRLGDPGRTMIELFAWLVDTLLYRANLIPERQRLAFLRLLDLPLKAAVPATGLVTLGLDGASAVTLRAGARVKGPVMFETRGEITVLPVTAMAFYKRDLDNTEATPVSLALKQDLKTVYQLAADPAAIRPYATTAIFAGGTPVPGGFDLIEQTVDRCLWLALLAPQPELVETVRLALGRSETGDAPLLNVGVVPLLELPALFEDVGPRARLPYQWEICTGRERDGRAEYLPLTEVADTSGGLTRLGVLRLELPAPGFIGALSNDGQAVTVAGVGDRPPRLDDAKTAARLVTWIRLRPTASLSTFALSWVGINAVAIDQRLTSGGQIIGQSDGRAGQEFALPGQSVEADSLQLQVEEPGLGYRLWRLVGDLALADRDDAVYSLDPEAGLVRFGDNVRGRIPEVGLRIRVGQMRAGGGRAGNLPGGSLGDIAALDLQGNPVPQLKLWQPLATSGGEDPEDLAAAEQRIPAQLRHGDRAVTEGDYQRLAADTPGIAAGRVEVLPRFKPQQRRSEVPGVVSVMVWPQKGTPKPPNPRPDRPFLEAVFAQLDRRRPLGTELYVIGCEYRPLGITVGVELQAGARRDSVLQAIRQGLHQFLWPLAPGDVGGQGWRLGKTVRDRELEVIVARVDGVRSVAQVKLFEPLDGGGWRKLQRADNPNLSELPLDPWQLPELLTVVVITDGDAPDTLETPPSPAADAVVAVPVVAEVC